MKKIIALLSVAAVLFAFAGCKKDEPTGYPTNLTPEEIASLEAEKAIIADMEEREEELGESIRGEKLVGKEEHPQYTEYFVVYFDNDGLSEYIITYAYYDRQDHYQNQVDIGDKGVKKFIESDDELRLVIYRTEAEEGGYTGYTYDQIIEDFKAKSREIVGDVGQ